MMYLKDAIIAAILSTMSSNQTAYGLRIKGLVSTTELWCCVGGDGGGFET